MSSTGGQPGPVGPVQGTAPALPAGPADRPAGLHARLRAKAIEAAGELRFVCERPPSLIDHLAYARVGEWTEEIDGYRRHAALIWAWLVAIPISTLAYLTVWSTARAGRCASVVGVTLLLDTALARIPVIGWFIPAWASLTWLWTWTSSLSL
jgi:hypothetical protein